MTVHYIGNNKKTLVEILPKFFLLDQKKKAGVLFRLFYAYYIFSGSGYVSPNVSTVTFSIT